MAFVAIGFLSMKVESHLYSVWVGNWRNPVTYFICFLLEHVPILQVANYGVFIVVVGFTYFKCTAKLLDEARRQITQGDHTNALLAYRKVTLLNISFNMSFGR